MIDYIFIKEIDSKWYKKYELSRSINSYDHFDLINRHHIHIFFCHRNDFSLLVNMKSSKSLFKFLYYLYETQNREEKCLLCAHKKDLFFSFFAFYSSTNGKISATKARVTTLTLLFFFTSSFQVPMGKKPQGILYFFSFIYSMV